MSDYFQLMSADGDRTVTRGNYPPHQVVEHAGKKLFSERVSKVWNSLPPSIVNFSSLATFRKSLNKINFRIYRPTGY